MTRRFHRAFFGQWIWTVGGFSVLLLFGGPHVLAASAPTVTTMPATKITSNSATLNATVNPNGLDTSFFFNWGVSTGYGNSSFPLPVGNGTSDVPVGFQITNLWPNTTYHFMVGAFNSAGGASGDDLTFTTLPGGPAPTAVTLPATNLTPSSMTLNGWANAYGLETTAYFEWGISPSFGNTTPVQAIGSSTSNINFSADLTGLSPTTSYQYRLVASNSAGTTTGNTVTLSMPPTTFPTAITEAPTNVTCNSATFNGTANPHGLEATATFEYGPTTAYGLGFFPWPLGNGVADVRLSGTLSGIPPNTTYHYRFYVTNASGSAYGRDVVFTTLGQCSAPTVVTGTASSITTNSASLDATVNPNGLDTTASFQWGATAAYGSTTASKSIGNQAGDTRVSVDLTELSAGTTYHYRIVASSSAGTAYGNDGTFTTLDGKAAPTAITDSPVNVASNSATLKGLVNPNGLDTTAYFRWGTTTAYGNTTVPQLLGNGVETVVASADITSLSSATEYHYQVVASNSRGTTYASNDVVFTTASPARIPIAATLFPRPITSDAATLSGVVSPLGSDATVYFRWGTSTSYGNTTPAQTLDGLAGNIRISYPLTGLVPNTLYHVQIVANSSAGSASANDVIFITAPSAMTSMSLNSPPTEITTNHARLNGAIHSDGHSMAAYFRWGTSSEYGNFASALSIAGTTANEMITAELSGLSPNTTYYYQVVTAYMGVVTYASNAMVFTTLATGSGLTVTTDPPTQVKPNSALFHGRVNPNGLSSTVFFRYGVSDLYGSMTALQVLGGGTSEVAIWDFGGLVSNTTYHYQLVASNSQGTEFGNDMVFTTPAVDNLPDANTRVLEDITPTSATLVAGINPNGLETTYFFRWGTSTSYGNTTSPLSAGNGREGIVVSVDVQGLSPDTTYHYQIVASNGLGTASGGDVVFTTPPLGCPVRPIISGSTIDANLTENSCKSLNKGEAWHADRYLFTAVARQQIAVTVMSSDFDPYIYLMKSATVIASDDNGGGGVNSRIPATTGFFTLSEAGTYTIEVTSAHENATGVYSVRLGLPSGPLFSRDLSLLGGGAGSTTTTGTGKSIRAGFATGTTRSNKGAEFDASSSPYGTAIFSVTQNGVVVSEAGVPASPPTTRGRVFVDFQSNVRSKAIHQNAGEISINTGFAIVNPGKETAKIKFELRSSGAIVAQGNSTLPPNQHRALFLNELSQMASDFILPSAFNGHGTLDILSDQPLSVVGLRLTTNQRGDTLITTTPIADLNQAPPKSTLYFPQFADGNGYKTMIMLMNTSDMLEKGRLRIRNNQGEPLPVSAGGSAQSEIAYSIQPGSLYVYLTDGAGDVVQAGSIQVVPDSGASAPVGAGVLSYSPAGTLVAETGIPAATPTNHARIYVDRTLGHNTGLAIAAPDDTPIYVTLNAYPEDGSTPAGNGGCDLEGHGHEAKFANEFIPTLPAGFSGVLEISAPSPFVALTLRSLVNARGDFLLTTFPIADANQPAPNPLIFPQIADGGGYQTQFILISTGSGTSTTLNFFGDDGAPLAVGKSGR